MNRGRLNPIPLTELVESLAELCDEDSRLRITGQLQHQRRPLPIVHQNLTVQTLVT